MEQQSQKRSSLGEGGPPAKKLKGAPELPGVYSDAVRKKLQSASRTGQACDRCKERKMRCDANPAGCGSCQLKSLRCVTTDRITGRPSERGQSDRLQVELMALRRHLAAYVQKYGPLDDAELAANDVYQDLPATTGYSTQHSQAFEQLSDQLTPVPANSGPYYGPIHGTTVDILDGEIDIADFHSPDMAEIGYNTGSVYNHSTSSYVRTVGGAQKPQVPKLPPREEGLKLIENFLKTLNTYAPMVHGPSVLELARKYFDEKDFKPSSAETVIIVSILANMNYQMAVRNPEAVAKGKMKESNHMFHYGLSLMCDLWLDESLPSMQAMALLLLHARVLPKPGYTWHFSTYILNRAIDMGYHRQPGNVPIPQAERNSPLALEMRKRVFWAVLGINVSTAVKLGRPMPFRMEDIDVEMPAPMEDSEISEDGISPTLSGKCTFWGGVYFHKLQPLLMELYNNFISVRRPSTEYLKNLETLNAKIVDFRQNWTKDIAVEAQDGAIIVTTHHVDDWAAEFELVLHHPRLCTANSPEVMEKNLDICHKAAARLLSNANALFHIFRGVDFTWHSTVGYVLALGITLHIHRRRIHQMTRDGFEAMRQEVKEWLRIMNIADQVLRTGDLYTQRFKPLVERLISDAHNVLLASSALQNGYQQGQLPHRNSDPSITNHTQAQPTPYTQSNGYNQSAYANTASGPMSASQSIPDASQNISAPSQSLPTTSTTHPPLYPEPYQHPHSNQLAPSDTTPTYQSSSHAHHTPVYPSNPITYQHDVQPQPPPHMATQLLGTTNYMTSYPQPGQNQHADTLLSLGQGWDDATSAAMWPQSIQAYMHHQQQGHHSGL